MSKLTIYFKSGNQVTIDRVTEWSVTAEAADIDRVIIGQKNPRKRLIVKSLDLKAIECIIEH